MLVSNEETQSLSAHLLDQAQKVKKKGMKQQ